MPRIQQVKNIKGDEPIYREVLQHAFRTAWHDRQFWILAILAGILVTGGSYDVLLRAFTSITNQGHYMTLPIGETILGAFSRFQNSGFQNVISIIGGIEILLFLAAIALALGVVSCVAQGGLVYALGARRRGHEVTVVEALRVGGHNVWPTIVLNALSYGLIWILRFLAAVPLYLALEQTTAVTYLMYIVSFGVFLVLSLLVAIVQIFALNGIVLQGATLADAVRRGYQMFKQHWVVVVETAILQFAMSVGIWFVMIVSFLVLMLPIFLLAMIASSLQSPAIIGITLVVGAIAFVMGLLAAAAFSIQLQYATWTYLFRRLGEGGVMPKLHRIMRGMSGFFHSHTS